jgi:hypothetical protein
MTPQTAEYTAAEMTDSELKRALDAVNGKIAAASGAALRSLEVHRRELIDEQDDRRRIRSARLSDWTA